MFLIISIIFIANNNVIFSCLLLATSNPEIDIVPGDRQAQRDELQSRAARALTTAQVFSPL